MIIREIKDAGSKKQELKKFGLTMGIVFGVFGLILFCRKMNYFYCFAGLSIIFLSISFICPILLKPVHKVWMAISIFLGMIMTNVILFLFFYIIFTPVGIIARLFGKRFLAVNFNRDINSYWVKRENGKSNNKDYESQF